MPEIVDALIVTLGLDASQYTDGQKKARDDISKTRETATRAASDTERAAVAAEAAQKRNAEAALKRQKELDAHAKALADTFGKLTSAAGAVFGAITLGEGLKSLVANVATSNATLGRSSELLGVSAQGLDLFRKKMEAVGGSADEANSALAMVRKTFETLQASGDPGNAGVLNALGLTTKDLADPIKGLDAIGQKLRGIQARLGHGRAVYMGQMLGLSEGMLNYELMPDDKRGALDKQVMGTMPTPAAIKEAEDHAAVMAGLDAAVKNLGSRISEYLLPVVDKVATGFGNLAKYLGEPGHEGELAAAGVGVTGAGIAGLIGANKVKNAVFRGIARQLVGGAVPAAGAAAGAGTGAEAVAGAAAGAAGGLGMAGSAILGAYVYGTHWLGEQFEKHVFSLRSAFGNDGTKKPIFGALPWATSSSSATSNPAANGIASAIGATTDDDLETRIAKFWDTFGQGMLDWAARSIISPANASTGGGGSGVGGVSSSPRMSSLSGLPMSGVSQAASPDGGGADPANPATLSQLRGLSPKYSAGGSPPGLDFGAATSPDIARLMNGGMPSPSSSGNQFGNLESQFGLPPFMLSGTYAAESSSGKDLRTSKAGAVGPFQFLAGTAKDYGVRDRMSLADSSLGAARYLSALMKMFGGDRRKAYAAYNWGEGNLRADIQRWGDDWDKHLPKETSDYLRRTAAGAEAARMAAAKSGDTHNSTVSVDVGDVTIHTAATDAHGIAGSMHSAIQGQSQSWIAPAVQQVQ